MQNIIKTQWCFMFYTLQSNSFKGEHLSSSWNEHLGIFPEIKDTVCEIPKSKTSTSSIFKEIMFHFVFYVFIFV